MSKAKGIFISTPRRNIVTRTLRGFARTTVERFEEWRYGIYTETNIGLKECGISDTACHHYAAFSYIRFRELMKKITIREGEDVFIDIGSGMGRVVVMAASYPFRRVMGVEISKVLDEVARKNVQKAEPRLRCKNIDLQCMDAREFQIPQDLSMVFFWSPFDETILSQVFANLRRSLEESPREMTIIYTYPPEHTCLDRMKHELYWLDEMENTTMSTHVSLVLYKYSPSRSVDGRALNRVSASR